MLNAADNECLTRSGPGTPMGALMRRFWLPVALSAELPEPDGAPLRVRVLGEDLVAFRSSDGRVGLVEPHCAHRGANLFFGRNEAGGIRCIYHGWKFDLEGHAVEMPNVPAAAASRSRTSITAYPTREFAEMIWAYLGPHEFMPEMPQLEAGQVPPAHRYVTKKLQQCNWAQSVEGALDTAHFSFLHMPAPKVAQAVHPDANADARRLAWMRDDPMPQFSFVEHAAGFAAGAARRADGEDLYWRITQFLLPNHSLAPNAFPGESLQGQTWVPITDTECWIYTYAWNPARALTDAERAKLARGHGVIAETDTDYVPLRRRENDYLIDRAAQRNESFTGVRGVSEQDAMVQDSQGLIADRTREHLTATDAAVVRFRRVVLEAAKALAAGKAPAAVQDGAAYRLRSGSWVAHRDKTLAEVMRERFGDMIGRAPQDD
ncbi:MAG: Rieske 2Fe-2S domain-containing protein [Burkholderiales bacterium]